MVKDVAHNIASINDFTALICTIHVIDSIRKYHMHACQDTVLVDAVIGNAVTILDKIQILPSLSGMASAGSFALSQHVRNDVHIVSSFFH